MKTKTFTEWTYDGEIPKNLIPYIFRPGVEMDAEFWERVKAQTDKNKMKLDTLTELINRI